MVDVDISRRAELQADWEMARALLVGRLGVGSVVALDAIRTDPIAEKLYQCSLDVIASLIELNRVQRQTGL